MADHETPTECVLLTTWADDKRNIDHWVSSHQILPYFATIYGWDFRWVIIAVYGVETVENFVWCLERSYTEDFSNTSISDPLHGIFGAILGYIFRWTFDAVIRDEQKYVLNIRELLITIFDIGIMVLPSAIFYKETRNTDWLYLIFYPIAFLIISRHMNDNEKKMQMFFTSYIYVITLCCVIFGHPLNINSFYAGWIVAIGFAFLLTLSKLLRISDNNYIGL